MFLHFLIILAITVTFFFLFLFFYYMFCVFAFSETAALCPDSPGRPSCQDKHPLVQKHGFRRPDIQLFGFGNPDDSKSRWPGKEDD